MMQKNLIQNPLTAAVGEHIGFELGAKMVKDFQDSFPSENIGFYVGRNIIESLLAQPGCVGIKMFNALNETGEKTLVFVGIDERGRHILEYNAVNQHGELVKKEGIVADRILLPSKPGGTKDEPTPPTTPTTSTESTSWW